MFLASTAMKFVELSPEEDIYQFIGEQLKEITGNSIVVISSFDETSSSFCVQSVVGIGRYMDAVLKIMGRHPVGITSSINDEARLTLTSGKLVKVPGHLYEFSFGEIPKAICHAIEQLLNLGDIYDMGFAWKGKLFGSAAILTRKGTKLGNQSIIETFVSQVSVALQRWHAERVLQQARGDLEMQVKKRTAELTKVNEELRREVIQRKQTEEELKRSTEKMVKALEDTIQAMAMIVEMRDPYTAGHQRRVTRLACAIAKKMDFSENQTNALRLAGLIHDIGKIRVPSEILTNPDGLSEAEFNMIKMHPLVGYEILSTIEFPWPIAQIVYQHHERMDGSGYPSGLSGEDILPEARILAVADVIEAMSSHRPYRPALGIDKALSEITQKKGVLYDANVVDACLWLFTEKSFKFE
jgi:putative nucleotidyltransferase with HDIG domain